jgi:hypothetical protein
MRLSARFIGLMLVGSGALALNVCGGSGAPSVPTQPTAPPVATPTPAPTPDPPISSNCTKLPPGSTTASCRVEEPDFQDEVDAAIRTLQGQYPQMFDGDRVLKPGGFYVELIKILDRQGLCAATDGEELGVASNGSYNEQYDVLTANQGARFGPSSYRLTCTPSAVPLPSPGLPPQQAGCPLAPSREIACGREPEGQFYGDVEAAITQILTDKPELFDFDDRAPGTDFVRIRDLDAYNKGLVDILRSRGFCAKQDGEEIAVKKGSNATSEQYDVEFSGTHTRRGGGIYRLTCYPAAF